MTESLVFETRPARPPLGRLVGEAASRLRIQSRALEAEMLAELPRGDGHAVLVLPPAMHGDRLTAGTRRLLGQLNYHVHGWELGPNVGPSVRLVNGVRRRLVDLARRHGKVSLVGYSMGGLFARYMAHQAPDLVRQVITVCSPFRAPLTSCSLALAPLCWRWSGARERAMMAVVSRPIPVPGTYLYSMSDGIVAWASCLEETAMPGDNIAFEGSHLTITTSLVVTRIIAERLAAPRLTM